MQSKLRIYNSLTRQKEVFEPIDPEFVGMYVCGPTVYNDVHLGNVRTFLCFDVIYRYLMHLGYKVRYVRNITDVGHLENDDDDGEDKIGKKARSENVEPMEIVQRYSNGFHEVMRMFNILDPDIEPTATGHIQEQIRMIDRIIDAGFAYESNGSVYFDVARYNEKHQYGVLSGRVLDDLVHGSRELDKQDEKRNPYDFALWKKADPRHIMKWDAPWSRGFPGWHLECSVMSTQYLGQTFDIHGGGLDLKFPHHECEIAQSVGATGSNPVKYWIHTNMLTVNGQKMSKSLGNSFLPRELVLGDHELLDRPYSPMTVRFFMLQSHYSSTLDFSNEALKAAAKGYKKLMNGLNVARALRYVADGGALNEQAIAQIHRLIEQCTEAMNDDFNTANTIAHLFNLLKKINSVNTGNLRYSEIGEDTFRAMIDTYTTMTEDVLGLVEETVEDRKALLDIILAVYKEAKKAREYDRVDAIRAHLREHGIVVKDMKDKIEWAYDEQ